MKNDCFARHGYRSCNALTVTHCIGEGCSFYKSREQYNADTKQAQKRLLELDAVTLFYILEKYRIKLGA